MKNIKKIIAYVGSAFVVALAIWGIALFVGRSFPVLGDSGAPNFVQSAVNASSSCGQLSQTSFTVGPTSASTSTNTGIFTFTINGVTVTSTSENTSTAATVIAGDIRNAINAESSTLGGLSVSTSSNVVNVTSTVWGNFLTPGGATSQNGLTLSYQTAGPQTQIVGANGIRQYFDVTNPYPTGTYVCDNATCTVGIGHYLGQNQDYQINYPNLIVTPISCIGSVATTSGVSYISR